VYRLRPFFLGVLDTSTAGGDVTILSGVEMDSTGEGGMDFPSFAEVEGLDSSCVSDADDFDRGRDILIGFVGVAIANENLANPRKAKRR
jgi:hypothetical protein